MKTGLEQEGCELTAICSQLKVDAVSVLTESIDPAACWRKLKQWLK
jgi:hypothetical protein